MGQNFALNMASHGFRVCIGNRSQSKVDLTVQRALEELPLNPGKLPIIPSNSPQDFCSKLSKPRKIVLLVQGMTCNNKIVFVNDDECILMFRVYLLCLKNIFNADSWITCGSNH